MPAKKGPRKNIEEKYTVDVVRRRKDIVCRKALHKYVPFIVDLMNEAFNYGRRLWEESTDQRNFIVCYQCPGCGRATISPMERFPLIELDTETANTRKRNKCGKSHNECGCGFEVEVVCEASINYPRSANDVGSVTEDSGVDYD